MNDELEVRPTNNGITFFRKDKYGGLRELCHLRLYPIFTDIKHVEFTQIGGTTYRKLVIEGQFKE